MKKTYPTVISIYTSVTILFLFSFLSQSVPAKQNQLKVGSQKTISTSFPSTQTELKTSLEKILNIYRKIIVLFDDEASLSTQERDRCVDAGRKLYYEKQELLDEIAQSLNGELRKALATRFKEKTTNVEGFIDYVINSPTLRDADRLAFLDLADELLTTVQESRVTNAKKSALQNSLQKFNDELKSIQDVYREEMARIFSRFNTRGQQQQREKWQQYVLFLKSFLKREQILAEYGTDSSQEQGENLRGARRDTKSEIYGYDLPAHSIVLTFDDGPHRRYTDEILAILKKFGAKAFFFNVGKNLGDVNDKNIKLLPTAAISKRAAESGHILANHSYSHPNLTKLASTERDREITKTNQLLEKIAGTKPILFRPPYGAKNNDMVKEIEAQGMRMVLWNIDSLDWADPIPESIAQRVIHQLNENKKGILLLHDIHKQSVAALPRILEELVKEDYTFLILTNGEMVAANSARSNTNTKDAVQATSESANKNYYRDSWAVVIGINDYKNWPKLRYCVNDANSIEELLLNKLGFKKNNIIKLLNAEATRERIINALDQLADTGKISKEDRVFVFFAGHGATRKLPSGKELGYIVPVDADID
ncbi:MAG: polysaccharide deacetylase family protein, partial [Acidobacteriota bacterium]